MGSPLELMEYALVARDQVDDLTMVAARGSATAKRVLRAITEWDAEGQCINCKATPLPAPEAFIVILSDSETFTAGVCQRCAEDTDKLTARAWAHVRRAYPSMQTVKPGTA
jgi:hypothetical protein